jgi:hypothetical protein
VNGGEETAPARDLTFVREFLAAAARSVGVGHLGWPAQIVPRVERSGRVGPWPLERHFAEIRQDSQAIATRAAMLAAEHPAVIEGDVDATLHVRLRLQAIAAHQAALEHELRQLEHLATG